MTALSFAVLWVALTAHLALGALGTATRSPDVVAPNSRISITTFHPKISTQPRLLEVDSGEPDAKELAVLDEITRWMAVNSEGIYTTKP